METREKGEYLNALWTVKEAISKYKGMGLLLPFAKINISDYFTSSIDSCSLYVNASTRFTDGGEFGLGAEIGIAHGIGLAMQNMVAKLLARDGTNGTRRADLRTLCALGTAVALLV